MENKPDWLDGDRLLDNYRADPMFMGFFDIADDDAAWGPWLAMTPPGPRQPIITAVHGLSITYRKNRDITAARKWAGIHLRLARSLPEDFGPRQGALAYGRDRYIGDALCGVARLEQIQGSVERAHHLLLEAERHYDAEEAARKRDGITERPADERILGVGSVRAGLYEDLAESAVRLGLMDQARHYFDLWQGSRGEIPVSGDQISELVQAADVHRSRGQLDAALWCLGQAVEIAEMESQELTAITRSACGAYQSTARVYASLGTPRSALAMLDKAKALVDVQAEPTLPAGIEVDTAHIFRDFPFLGDPLPHLLRALEHHSVPADAGDDRSWRRSDGALMRVAALDVAWPVLLETAEILEGRGRLAESADFLRLAVGIAEQVRNGALNETSRMAVQNQLSQAFIDLARVQLRLAEEPSNVDAGEFADAAWQAVEALRARSFLDALGDVELPSPAGADPGLVAREAELLERRRTLRLSPVRDDSFWTEQELIDRGLAALWEGMAAASPEAAEYVAVRQARPASRTEVAELITGGSGRDQAGRVVVVNMLFPDDERLVLLAVDAVGGHVRVASSPVDRRPR
jgi:tetratricopeptide (TPR) repeat protein